MLILASGSPRRAKILRDCGVEFTVVKSDAPEVSYPHDPERTVRENALAKGQVVLNTEARRHGAGAGVLSADTIVWFDGKIYGKPKDLDEAKEYLRELSGNVHTVFTGVAYDGDVKVVKSDVKFRELSEAPARSVGFTRATYPSIIASESLRNFTSDFTTFTSPL